MQFISRIIMVAVVMTTLLVSSFTIPTPKTSLPFTSCLVPSVTSSCRLPTQRFLSDQWDDEEEDLPKVTSYDDAATTLMKRKEEMDLMDQSDQGVPGSESDAQEAIRDAVKARTLSLGLETASQDALREVEQRAAQRGSSNMFSGMVDLSKVTSSENSFDKLSINYDPEDEMTEEEMRQADPLGYQPVLEQYLFELKETTFPNLTTTVSKVGLLIALGFVTGVLILQTDQTVRALYVQRGMLPSPEDIRVAQSSGLELAKELVKDTTSPSAAMQAATESSEEI